MGPITHFDVASLVVLSTNGVEGIGTTSCVLVRSFLGIEKL